MRKINLIRLNHNEPDFEEFNRMLCELKKFLEEDVNPSDKTWMDNYHTITGFQDVDGSFKFLDSYEIPMDARVDYCHVPTYICTAILMKAFMADERILGPDGRDALEKALEICCKITIAGNGIEFFEQADIAEFVLYHNDICPRFCNIMKRIVSHYNVFVYGTLMRGEKNHDHFIQDDWFVGKASVSGYDMYDIGAFPGIVPGTGTIPGEIYEVDDEALQELDYLEGEGSLYIRECVSVKMASGETIQAFIYVYNGDVDYLEKIPMWRQDDYVWYVSYGSNMLRDRFMHYIKGGAYENGGAYHTPCEDLSDPLAVKPFEIPFDMYFGNTSGSWEGKGVSFLDITKTGSAKGVAYLITHEQFDHVAREENGGREPENNPNWYNKVVPLGLMDGCEVVTITNSIVRNYNEPAGKYFETLKQGLQENYPELTIEEIEEYLNTREGMKQ